MPAPLSHRPGRCRIRRIGVAAALAVAIAGAGATLVATPASAAAPASASVKFWIVAPAQNGHKEFLYEIAQRALGNGKRYMEIFALNKGRLQPDGGKLTDPSTLDPGWILQLPADAHGPGVHIGPLPAVTADASSPDAGTAAADSAGDIAAARQGSAADVTATGRHGRTSRRMIVGGALAVLAALLLGLLLVQVRRRRVDPDDEPDDGPDGDWPDGPLPPAAAWTSRSRIRTAPAPGPPTNGPAAPSWTAAAPGWHPAPGWAADPVGAPAVGRPGWEAAEAAPPIPAIPRSTERNAPMPAWQPVTPSAPPPATPAPEDHVAPAQPTSSVMRRK